MPTIRRCGHVHMRLKVHTALLSTNEANLPPTSRPLNRSHNTAVNRDRWRRYGAFVASVAERAHHGASYNPLSERTIQNPYPVYARLRRHSPVHRSVILGELDPEPVRRRTGGREGSRAVLQRPALAKRNRERAPTRAGRLQHPARRPARAHATSQGRGASVHPTEADGAGADHRGARQRHRRARHRARGGGVDRRGRAADGDAGDASHARDRRGRGDALAQVVRRARPAAGDDRDARRAKDRAHHRREHDGALPRASRRARQRGRRRCNQSACTRSCMRRAHQHRRSRGHALA